MVEQLGLAIMRSSIFNTWPLISGTTNFLVGFLPPGGRFINHDRPFLRIFWPPLKRSPPASGKNGNIGREIAAFFNTFYRVFLILKFYFLSYRFGRRDQIQFVKFDV